MRSRSSRFLLLLCILVSSQLELVEAATQLCRNALFQMHWFTHGAIECLANVPGLHSNLRMCPAYDGIISCCQESFEEQQAKHFSFWKQILVMKIWRIRKSMEGVQRIRTQDVYSAASESDKQQLRRALETYGKVLELEGHANCFAALMTYVAGMICFSCEPTWKKRVLLGAHGVIRVNIAETTCTALWESCADFSVLATQLRQAVFDSRLAIMQSTPFENLAMFDDQQALCDWAHDAIALHPFTTPGEAEREATPARAAQDRRLRIAEANWTRAELSAASPSSGSDNSFSSVVRRLESGPPQQMLEYDAIKAGHLSGFPINWHDYSGKSGGRVRHRLSPLAALAVTSTLAAVILFH